MQSVLLRLQGLAKFILPTSNVDHAPPLLVCHKGELYERISKWNIIGHRKYSFILLVQNWEKSSIAVFEYDPSFQFCVFISILGHFSPICWFIVLFSAIFYPHFSVLQFFFSFLLFNSFRHIVTFISLILMADTYMKKQY